MSKGIPRGAPGRRPGAPAPAPNLKPGQVVFFMGCKKSTKTNAQPIIFKNGAHGFGIFMGVVPLHVVEPGQKHINGLMAGLGWVSFDNIIKFLGEDQFNILSEKFQGEYELEAMTEDEVRAIAPPPMKEAELSVPAEKKLVGLDGRVLTSEEDGEPDATVQ